MNSTGRAPEVRVVWVRFVMRAECDFASSLPILTLFLVPLSLPHPRTAAVLLDELDPCHFECPTNRLQGRAARLACTRFELMAAPDVELARCFLRLANLPNYVLDRLSRYEATLWRQAGQI